MMAARIRKQILGLITILLGTPLAAQVLPIQNPGFETLSRPLLVGEITNGAGGTGVQVGTLLGFFSLPQYVNTVEVPGWRTFLPVGNPPFVVHAGVMNPPVNQLGQPFLTGYSGTNVATVRHVWMQQTLPVKIQPRTRYTLTFLSGSGLWEPGDGVYVALLAAPDLATPAFHNTPNVTTLTLSNLHPPPGSQGQMLPWRLEYTSPAVLPGDLGSRYLAITFVGGDGITLMNYDDFRLEAKRVVHSSRPVAGP